MKRIINGLSGCLRKARSLRGRGPDEKYPFKTMQVGDAFVFVNKLNSMQVMVSRKNRKFSPKQFVVRKDPWGNYAVYRVR